MLLHRRKATPARNRSADGHDIGDPAEKARLVEIICKSWNIEQLTDVLGPNLKEYFKQDTSKPDITIFKEDTLRAFIALAQVTQEAKERQGVKRELEVMWKQRSHGKTPRKTGGDIEGKNWKLIVDIKLLTRAAKRRKGIPLTDLDKVEEMAYKTDYGIESDPDGSGEPTLAERRLVNLFRKYAAGSALSKPKKQPTKNAQTNKAGNTEEESIANTTTPNHEQAPQTDEYLDATAPVSPIRTMPVNINAPLALNRIKHYWDVETPVEVVPKQCYEERLEEYPQVWSYDVLERLYHLSKITEGRKDEVRTELAKAFSDQTRFDPMTTVKKIVEVHDKFAKEKRSRVDDHGSIDDDVQIIEDDKSAETADRDASSRSEALAPKRKRDDTPPPFRSTKKSRTTLANQTQTDESIHVQAATTSSMEAPVSLAAGMVRIPHRLFNGIPIPTHLSAANVHKLQLLMIQSNIASSERDQAEIEAAKARIKRSQVYSLTLPGAFEAVEEEVTLKEMEIEERKRAVLTLSMEIAKTLGVRDIVEFGKSDPMETSEVQDDADLGDEQQEGEAEEQY